MIKAEVKTLKSLHSGYITGVTLYAILVTLFTAIRTEAFISDFKSFFMAIWRFIYLCGKKLLQGADWTAELGDKIPQEVVATIVHWILWILVIVVGGGAVAYMLFVGITRLVQWFKEEYSDNLSLGFALVSLALIIFFADVLRGLMPINLILLFVIAYIVFIGARWFVKFKRGY